MSSCTHSLEHVEAAAAMPRRTTHDAVTPAMHGALDERFYVQLFRFLLECRPPALELVVGEELIGNELVIRSRQLVVETFVSSLSFNFSHLVLVFSCR